MRITNEKLGNIIETLTDYHANGSYERLKENVELLSAENYAVMIRTTNFSQNNFNENLNYITESAYNYLKKSKVYAGDIVMNKIADAGACYFMPEIRKPVSLGMNLFLIRINKQLANSFFIFSYLKFHEFYVKSFASGSATKTITKEDVRKLKVYLPKLGEQNKIANILRTWDKAIRTTERLIDNSKQQKKALMQQLLTGKKRLLDDSGKPFDDKWGEHILDQVFTFKRGKDLSKGLLSKEGRNKCILYGELYTRYSEIIHKVFSRTDSDKGTLSCMGDILFPSSTTTYGIDLANATAILEDNVLLGGDIIILRPKIELSPNFISHILTHVKKYEIAALAQGITIIHLYASDLKCLKVTFPKDIKEQQKIAAILTSTDKEIELLEEQLVALKQEKKALMQQLLTGKRRVKI